MTKRPVLFAPVNHGDADTDDVNDLVGDRSLGKFENRTVKSRSVREIGYKKESQLDIKVESYPRVLIGNNVSTK